MNTINLLEDDKCIACGKCIWVCHKDAITFCIGDYGNICPTIDGRVCDSCGRCVRECEKINSSIEFKDWGDTQFYIGKINDKYEVTHSASGGIFFEIAKRFVENDGIVYGASYDPFEKAITIQRGTTIADVQKMRKSKYVQSNYEKCRKDLDKDVRSGKDVLISGLPCQIVAIKDQFKGFNNVYLIDLFCHGVIGYRYFQDFIYKQNVEIDTVDFRDNGYNNNYKLTLKKDENSCFSKDSEECLEYMLFIYGANLKKICYECPHSVTKHVSDITLGDFSNKKIASDCGYSIDHLSAISVNTEKGNELLEKIKEKITVTQVKHQETIDCYYLDHKELTGTWGYNKDLWELFYNNYNETHDIDIAGISVFQKENDLLQRLVLMKIEDVWIYGTGEVAKIVSMLINEFYPSINILGFLRTKVKNGELFLGRQVFQFDKFMNKCRGAYIVVCVKNEYKAEIEKALMENNINRYLVV